MMRRFPPPTEFRPLQAHEKTLWRMITRHDTPLHPNEETEEDEAALSAAFDVDVYAAQQPVPVAASAPARPALAPLRLLAAGDFHAVDRRTAMRIKRNQWPVDVLLDLHGSTQIEAYERLQHCIERASQSGKRLVAVITGKGKQGDGVLKQQLPYWLNAPAIRPLILAFDRATAMDQAGGAWLVLLKRERAHAKNRPII